MTQNAEYERLRKQHNAAVANGFIVRARQIAKVMDAIERRQIENTESIRVCPQYWRNLDSGHLCWCGLPWGHGEPCRCGDCGAAATAANLYPGTHIDSSGAES